MPSIDGGAAPDEATDAPGLTDAYAGFEALLFEIDFVVSDLPPMIPALQRRTMPPAEAIVTITEVYT